jgi:hypothetical protein
MLVMMIPRIRAFSAGLGAMSLALLLLGSRQEPSKEPRIVEDRSLSSEEYVKRGFPAPDKIWLLQDFTSSLELLKNLSAENPLLLPRSASPKSGKYFARIVDVENLGLLTNTNLPIAQRFPIANGLMLGVKGLLMLYGVPPQNLGCYDRETIELANYEMLVLEAALRLMNEFQATLPKDDPLAENRKAGRLQMLRGAAMFVESAYLMMTERESYRLSERVRLGKMVKERLPGLFPHLLPLTQQEMLLKVEKCASTCEEPELKPVFTDISTTLKSLSAKIKPAAGDK